MTRNEIRAAVLESWRKAEKLGIAETLASTEPFSPSTEFRDVVLKADAEYEEVYLAGLSSVQYNFAFKDYSYLQFGWTEGDALRFAYYPNPFLGSSSRSMIELGEMREFIEEGILTIEDYLHRVSELRFGGHPPHLRYENAADQYIELVHPCSHFHFGFHSENRWPVRRILTPLAFTLLVMKYFYSAEWAQGREGLLDHEQNPLDIELEHARAESQQLPRAHFSEEEERHFFFA